MNWHEGPDMKLNLGAGGDPQPEYVNLDRVQLPNIDVVHDLDTGPWPFADGSAEIIRAFDIFEHLDNPILFMTECHRILQPLGHLHIQTPLFPSVDAFTDPTHKRFPTQYTFHFWIPGNPLYARSNAAYGGVAFLLSDHQVVGGQQQLLLSKTTAP